MRPELKCEIVARYQYRWKLNCTALYWKWYSDSPALDDRNQKLSGARNHIQCAKNISFCAVIKVANHTEGKAKFIVFINAGGKFSQQ
jgi:hypothetical protein